VANRGDRPLVRGDHTHELNRVRVQTQCVGVLDAAGEQQGVKVMRTYLLDGRVYWDAVAAPVVIPTLDGPRLRGN